MTPGKAFILGYTNDKTGVYDATNNNVIIFDDFTTATKFVDFKFKVKSSAMKILVSKDSSEYNIKYFFYLLNTIRINTDTHKRFWISEYEDYYVTIPVHWYQNLAVDFLDVLFYKIDLIAKENNKLINIIEVTKSKILNEIFSDTSSYKSYYENYVCIKDLINTISTRNKEVKTQQIKNKGKYPVVSQSQLLIDGYYDDETKLIMDFPLIIFGDHTRCVKYINFAFIPGADGTKLLKPINLDSKYLYYGIIYASNKIYNDGYARHFSKLKEILLPIVNKEFQIKIVNYIDRAFHLLDSII